MSYNAQQYKNVLFIKLKRLIELIKISHILYLMYLLMIFFSFNDSFCINTCMLDISKRNFN